jgi:hypothetical protein
VTGDERRLAERRTTALRGPGAGSFTPPQSLAASNPCSNCGTNIQLEYCPECGQRAIDPDPTVRELLHEVAEELLGWDGKLVRTFRLLIEKPGALTREYLAGRRARYISPLRVYLACSVFAFFVSAMTPDPPSRTHNGKVEQVGQGQLVADKTLGVKLGPPKTSTASDPHTMDVAIRKSFARAQADPAGFRAKVADAVPKLLFVLVPLLAVLVAVGFRSRTSNYPQHLAFTLHVHAFAFLTLAVAMLVTLAKSYTAFVWGRDAALLIIFVYAVLAARRVYGRGLFSTSARMLVIGTLYFLLFYASLGMTSILLAFTY